MHEPMGHRNLPSSAGYVGLSLLAEGGKPSPSSKSTNLHVELLEAAGIYVEGCCSDPFGVAPVAGHKPGK